MRTYGKVLTLAACFLVLLLLPEGCSGDNSEVDAMEKPVVSNFRVISAAQLVYRSGKGSYGNVNQLIGEGLIDSAWDRTAAGGRVKIRV